MKLQLISIFLFTVLADSKPVYAQQFNFRIYLFATDAGGRKDTVELGFNPDFTNGQDEQLGEINVFGQPADTLDMRIIQRNQANWNNLCNGIGEPIYFDDNFDSKLNLRKDLYSFGTGDFFYFGNFELQVQATDFPVTITSDLSQMPPYFSGWSTLTIMGSGCTVLNETPLDAFLGSQTLAVLDQDLSTLKIYLQHEVSVKDQFAHSRFKVVPNPGSSHFSILGLESEESVNYEIVNGLSKTVQQGTSNGSFRLESLSPGIYYLKIKKTGAQIGLPFVVE